MSWSFDLLHLLSPQRKLGPMLDFHLLPRCRLRMDPSFRWGDRVGLLAMMAAMMMPAPLHADSAMPAAALADTQLPDPKQEAEATALMETLRCVVCQGQSIADSDAEIAGDMRALVRERIQRGEKPDQIRAWMIERYGEWISYDPPFSGRTALLWLAPLLALAGGIFLARGRFKRRAR